MSNNQRPLNAYTVIAQWLRRGYTGANVITPKLHRGYTVVTLGLQQTTPNLHRGYTVLTPWLHRGYTGVTPLRDGCINLSIHPRRPETYTAAT